MGAFGTVESLLGVDDNGNLIPKLAIEWEKMNDNEWKFHLRKGVLCHDGSVFNSHTVKFSIERLLDSKNKGWVNPPFDSIIIEDDYTFIIRSKYATVLLPYYLSRIDMMAPSSLDEGGHFARPVGTGPFMFKEGIERKYMLLERNKNYWDGVPKLEKVIVKGVKDHKERIQMLENGDVDVITEIHPKDIIRLRDDGKINVILNQFPYTHQLLFNTKKYPFDDLSVRRAINHAIDRDYIVTNVLEDLGTAASGPFPLTFPGISQGLKRYLYSPKKAKSLLTNVGWKDIDNDGILEKDGERFKVSLLVYSYRAELPLMAMVLKEQLKEVGISVNVQILEMEQLNSIIRKNEHEMVLSGRAVGSMPDPYEYLVSDFSSMGRNNRSGYGSAEVDLLLEAARTTLDSKERYSVYYDVQQIIMNDTPIAFISHDVLSAACQPNIKGFEFESVFDTSYTVKDVEIVNK